MENCVKKVHRGLYFPKHDSKNCLGKKQGIKGRKKEGNDGKIGEQGKNIPDLGKEHNPEVGGYAFLGKI